MLPHSRARTTFSSHVAQGYLAEDTLILSVQVAYDRLKQEPIPERLLALALQLK
jgi:hypothetical protein